MRIMFFTLVELSIATLGTIIVPSLRPIILILLGSTSGCCIRTFKSNIAKSRALDNIAIIGMLWALLGIEIHRFALSHRIQQPSHSESEASEQQLPTPRLAALRSALMIGIASAIVYTIGLVLGLPRDFWAVLTIIVAIRPSPSLTISVTYMMVLGTIIGALIAAVITLENSNPYLRLALLFSFAIMLFATMRVNVILTQIFLVPFIIILLKIYYPGEWYLLFIRILDVATGGAIAVAMVYLWSALSGSRFLGNRTP